MRRSTVAAVIATFLCVGVKSFAAERYDPHLSFRTIRTAHFTILFHQGEDELARRLAAIAEEVHTRLSGQLRFPGSPHTRVILVDQHDEANGWATPLPFDTIEIAAAAPSPSSATGNTDDWLRLVFTHEYTHILHLDRSRGVFGGLRRVFGRAPLLFPNMFLPGWETEGLATFYETTDTGLGRLRSGEFRLIVDAAARAGAFAPIDRATGALVDWPGANASYAYGSRFHEYLAARFGGATFGRLADATARRVPYLPGAAYKKVFGKSAPDLWREFAADVRTTLPDAAAPRTPIVRETFGGFVASGPRWLPDGGLVYSVRTPHGFPSLRQIPAGGGPPRTLATRYLGERAAVSDGHVYFDQRELVRSVALQGDLFVATLADGRVQRLTRGLRASDPDVSPDGRSLACAVQRAGRALLIVMPLDIREGHVELGAPTVLRDDPDTQYAAPRWSPDGLLIAAERRRLHARPDVVTIDARSHEITARVAANEGRVAEPEWVRGSSQLVVSWERPAAPFSLYRVTLAGGDPARALLDLPNGARSAAVSPAGDRFAFVGYSADGYDIFTAPLVDAAGPAETRLTAGPDSPAPPVDAGPPLTSAPYRPLGTLLPRFWMPVVETDEDRLEVGAGTVGLDVLGRHAFASTVRWADRSRPDWDISYAYDRWRPTLLLGASDDLTVWQGDDYRETSVDAGVLLPLRTVRRRQWLYGAFHATHEADPKNRFDRRALRGAYQFDNARRYGYSISPQDGVTLGTTAEVTRRALGSDADAVTLTADIRAYPRLGGRHRVLAIRAAAGGSWGDREGRRALGAGGSAAPASTIVFGHDAIGLARGFATDDIVGYRAAVINVDYRLPVWTVERGIWSFPIFVRQFHAAAFVDAAHVWTKTFAAADVRVSTGFELSSDVVLGHYLPLTLSAGVASRRDPSHSQSGMTAFWRIGYAF